VPRQRGANRDAETAFKASFTGAGGQIIESLRAPSQNPDFAPFIQRVKDAKPEAGFVFIHRGRTRRCIHEDLSRARARRCRHQGDRQRRQVAPRVIRMPVKQRAAAE
jgi:hypothetical protein